MAEAALRYRRVLIKISGEALMGAKGLGIDVPTLERIARDVKAGIDLGAELCLVVGGGNIYRGVAAAAEGMDRVTADYMGMLATVMNALALANALDRQGLSVRVLSAIPMTTVCEPFATARALHHLRKGRIVIFAGGTGNPFFTTDTTAALRAAETRCEAIAKATQVDGVYSADPRIDPGAQWFERLSYRQVLERDLKVMDGAAIALARDNDIPIIVFSIQEEGNLPKMLLGRARCTTVSREAV